MLSAPYPPALLSAPRTVWMLVMLGVPGTALSGIAVPHAALAIAGVGDAHLVVGTATGLLALRLTS